jgi:hypothetical protein
MPGLMDSRCNPLPVPEKMQQQAKAHRIASIFMDVQQKAFHGFSSGKEMEIDDKTGHDTDQAAAEKQYIQPEILSHRKHCPSSVL